MSSNPVAVSTPTNKSKRIAANTLLLFARMFAIMIINLYAVRIVLKGLGTEDYGTYNAVAGVVLASSFLTTTLAISIQRFYSYSIGEQNYSRLREIFSASLNIIIVLSIVALVLLESVGLWFLNNYLSVPIDRMVAANWVYQFSLFSFILSLFQLPYTAALFAHEDMGGYALISILECLLKLGVALLIGIFIVDSLVFYGVALFGVALVVFALYFFIARRRYKECHYQHVKEKGLYKSLSSFSGWTMYGALAGVATTYGNTIILNVFFGPITTAAYAISNQVSHAFQALSGSIVLPFRPSMVKSYAEKDFQYLNKLFVANNKLIVYLLLCIAIPIAIEMRTIFHWWLGDITEETIIFARLFLIYIICLAMHNPITTIMQADGRIKTYSLWTETTMMLCLPLSCVAFKLGAPSYYAIIILISVCFVAHAVRIICLHRYYPSFRLAPYVLSILVPSFCIGIAVSCALLYIHNIFSNPLLRLFFALVASVMLTVTLVYMFGINKMERQQIKTLLNKQIKRLHR